MPVGDEGLSAVEHPLVSLADGRATRAPSIGAGARLGETPGADPFAGREFGNVLFALLFIAGDKDVVRTKGRVRGNDDADRTINAREFFDRDYIFDIAHSSAAIFGGKDHSQETQ